MQSGDGWLVRVKPSAATLSADAARLITAAARRHGNGHIDLTSRANLQVRGLTPHSANLFAETIVGAGLASADAAQEAIRNVMASPLGPDDPAAAFNSHALAREIEAMLGAEPAFAALPAKFGIAVDGGGSLPLAGLTADIAVHAHAGGLAVRLDGGALSVSCPLPQIAETIKALAFAVLQLASERREPPRRLRALIGNLGEDAIFDAAGLAAAPAPPPPASARPAVGLIDYPGKTEGAFGVGLPFGRIEAEALTSLAAMSERYGDGTLRTTPWRALIVPGVRADDVPALIHAVTALGLIADADDLRLRIFACVGAPACRSASVDARGDASRIAAAFSASAGETLHVSGCGKSCAHRGRASLTLIGRDGRYDLIRNGSAGDRPSLAGLSLTDILALTGERVA